MHELTYRSWNLPYNFVARLCLTNLLVSMSGEKRLFELNVKVTYAPPRKLRFPMSGEKNALHFSHNALALLDIQLDPVA